MALVKTPPALKRFGDFTLDLRAGELRRHGRKVRLQEQPFQILALLIDRAGDVVTREEVQQRLWPADTFVDFDHGLNNAVARLRDALRDSADEPKYIETVARRGYRFIAAVEPVGAVETPTSAASPPPRSRRMVFAAAAIAVVALTWAGLRARAAIHPPAPGESAPRARQGRPVAPQAFDLYLRARYRLDRQAQVDIDQAIDLLERATALDPQFAVGFTELARAYRQKAFLFAPQQKELEEKAYVAVETALALDPDLPEGHLARGRTLWTLSHGFPHDGVIDEYWRALSVDPRLGEAHYELGHVYNHVGLLEEGLSELRQAVALNPSNTQARFRIGVNLAYQGRHEEALAVLRQIPRSASPVLWGFHNASTLLRLGRRDEARALLAELASESPQDEGGVRTSVEAILLAQDGARDQATARIRTAIAMGGGFGHFHHTAYNIGSAYALLGEPGAAERWLEAAADEGFPCYPLYASDPNLIAMRTRPAFVHFMGRLRRDWESRRARARQRPTVAG